MAFSKTFPSFHFTLGLISVFWLMCKAPADACITFREPSSDSATQLEVDTEKISITYAIRVGDGRIPEKWYDIFLTVPKNISFHSIMKLAAEKDSRFKFSEKEYSFGYYITEIAGVNEDLSQKLHWILYSSPQPLLSDVFPGDELKSAVGVSDLRPNNGETILFWYKTMNY